MTGLEILAIELEENDSGATTIRGYLIALLAQLWLEEEGFSGKRPFGNSGWCHDLFEGLVRAGAIEGAFDGDGDLLHYDRAAGNLAIGLAIEALRQAGW